MRLDIEPRKFETLPDLIESYIYGSAIVVGAFLTHVYGSARPEEFSRALAASRNLAIGLQLTNFLRDVAEDYRRGRLYLPVDWLRAEGLEHADPADPETHAGFGRVVQALVGEAQRYYDLAARDLDAFAPDSRIAIRACTDVYGLLNRRIRQSPSGLAHRESVPLQEKLRVLPPSKYWRIPLAYLLP
jgi:phytoene synthase